MQLKSVVIAGYAGDVEISRTGSGAHAVRGHQVITEFSRAEGSRQRGESGRALAAAVYGSTAAGG